MTAPACPHCKPDDPCVRHMGEDDAPVTSVPRASVPKPTPGSAADSDRAAYAALRQVLCDELGTPIMSDAEIAKLVRMMAEDIRQRAAEPTAPTEIASALRGADARIAMLERDIADYEERIAVIGRGVVAADKALTAAGAPQGAAVAERIEAWAAGGVGPGSAYTFPTPAPPLTAARTPSPTLIDALSILDVDCEDNPQLAAALRIVRREVGL